MRPVYPRRGACDLSESNDATSSVAPLAARMPIRSIEDVRRLEMEPLESALRAQSTYELIGNGARAFHDKIAFRFLPTLQPGAPEIIWTYGQLLSGIRKTANGLHSLGIEPSDAVAVILPGCLEYQLALWGGEATAIVQPLNPLLTEEKLASLLRASGAKALIAYGAPEAADYWAKALRLKAMAPALKHIIRVAPHDETAPPHLPEGCIHLADLMRDQPDDRLLSGRVIRADDVAAYFHTGGTTGAPKLAIQTHGNQVFSAWACVNLHGVTSTDRVINGSPLFHIAGVVPGVLSWLASGAETMIPTTQLMRNRDVVAHYWSLVERFRITVVSGVPTMLAALAEIPLAGTDISSVRYCRAGASALPAELADRFEREFGLHVHEMIGMTETAGIMAIRPQGVRAPAGCVGFVVPYASIRVVQMNAQGDATEEDVEPGQPGMLLFKAPNVFPGYLGVENGKQPFMPGGWLVTGDLGWPDDLGMLHIAGRAKDLIIRSGHNIEPGGLEDALGRHPAVQSCAAVGAPDSYAGELPVMFACLRPGYAASENELLEFVRARVDEAPARPKSVTLLDVLPTTNVGKIYKPDLRRLAARAVIEQLTAGCFEGKGLDPAFLVTVNDAERYEVLLTSDTCSEEIVQHVQSTLVRLPLKVVVCKAST